MLRSRVGQHAELCRALGSPDAEADVLTALSRIFVEAIFVESRKRARAHGLTDAECGAVTFVQR